MLTASCFCKLSSFSAILPRKRNSKIKGFRHNNKLTNMCMKIACLEFEFERIKLCRPYLATNPMMKFFGSLYFDCKLNAVYPCFKSIIKLTYMYSWNEAMNKNYYYCIRNFKNFRRTTVHDILVKGVLTYNINYYVYCHNCGSQLDSHTCSNLKVTNRIALTL